jgi:phosphatidylglycerol---prolipoprotein diacylglyceryl transferase
MAFCLDVDPVIMRLPYIGIPLTWYGLIFASAFYLAFLMFGQILRRYLSDNGLDNGKTVEVYMDKLLTYLIVATIIGARLGHILFYEDLLAYLRNPVAILKTWEGGLASHGGVLAIILAMVLFVRGVGKRLIPKLSFLKLLDLVAAPTLFVGFAIRVGNFINQEIIGPETQLFWGVVFMRPSDPVAIVMRHPTQLYEACFYLLLFIVVRALLFKSAFLKQKGRIAGLVLVFAFSIRLLLEPLKFEHSFYMQESSGFFRMGQFLSLPFILVGLYLFFRRSEVSFSHRQSDGESEI